jgi:hypothetical protein
MNRNYKDSVFTKLFSNENILRDLYNFFIYGGRVFEQLLIQLGQKKTVYQERLILLPGCEFLGFYNGRKDQPDCQELRLSDSFLTRGNPINLELTAKVYNINKGHNAELLERCKTLGMYAEFVVRVRAVLKKGMSKAERNKALRKVINGCINEGILEVFLKKHGSEVIGMLFTEWNWDDYFAVKREEAYEEAKEEFQEQIVARDERIRQDQKRILQLEEENRRLREDSAMS